MESFSRFKTSETSIQHQNKIEVGNFFDLYIGNSDSDIEFKGFDIENSSIMMLSLVNIFAMTWKLWIVCEPKLNTINSEYGFKKISFSYLCT